MVSTKVVRSKSQSRSESSCQHCDDFISVAKGGRVGSWDLLLCLPMPLRGPCRNCRMLFQTNVSDRARSGDAVPFAAFEVMHGFLRVVARVRCAVMRYRMHRSPALPGL